MEFLWVPSHKSLYGNEEADASAKKSLNLNEIELDTVYRNNIFPLFKKEQLILNRLST